MVEDDGRRRLIRSAVEAARRRRTPFYLFDRRAVVASARRWRAAAGPSAEIFYPWKCNREPSLIRLFASEGLGAEVTAAWDLETALERQDLGPERVLLQGPAKETRAIDLALASGARLVADSAEDALAILARSRALGAAPVYFLRLRPRAAEDSQSRFGLRPREAFALCRELARRGAAPPRGLAFHLGTGVPSPAPYVAAIREAGKLAAALAGLGVAVEALDAGGGFAAAGEARLDSRGRPRGPAATPERFLSEIRTALERSLPGARLLLEPGRAIVSDAFHLVTRVVRAEGRRLYVDASRLAHAFFVPRGRHAFLPVPRRLGGPPVEVAGPLPVDLDVLAAKAAVGRPREGDVLVVASVGAYNLIAANEWAGPKPEVVETGGASSSEGGRPSGRRTRPSL
jgi:diaminopimelate decarboxylase